VTLDQFQRRSSFRGRLFSLYEIRPPADLPSAVPAVLCSLPQIPDDWRTGQVVQELIKGYTLDRQIRFTDMVPGRWAELAAGAAQCPERGRTASKGHPDCGTDQECGARDGGQETEGGAGGGSGAKRGLGSGIASLRRSRGRGTAPGAGARSRGRGRGRKPDFRGLGKEAEEAWEFGLPRITVSRARSWHAVLWIYRQVSPLTPSTRYAVL
jgi:hypothetical protein